MIETLGGNKPFIEKLDQLFNQSSEHPTGHATRCHREWSASMPTATSRAITLRISITMPALRIRRRRRIRSLLETMYDNKPDGMAGNEDCGQMSAWFVISSLGLYAVDPVSARYDFGTPLFDRVELKVAGGRKLTIEAKRQSAKSIYIGSVEWNGSAREAA